MIEFTLTGDVPTKKNSYRIGKNGGLYKPDKVNSWNEIAWSEIKKQRVPKLAGKVEVRLIFHMKRDRDIDNAMTTIFDLLQMCQIIDNDKNIIAVEAVKFKAKIPETQIIINLIP